MSQHTMPASHPKGLSRLTLEAFEERLIDFGVAVCRFQRGLPMDIVGIHIARQLVRCSTSPAANFAEARAAESRRDFVHKMQIALKELRETSIWLRFAEKLELRKVNATPLRNECAQLIAMFVASINKALRHKGPS